jgi:hypothetical protein
MLLAMPLARQAGPPYLTFLQHARGQPHHHIVTAIMDDTMASRNGNNQIPIPTNNDNRQFQHAIMATVTPAADGKYPQTNQQSILRYYPNSVPVSALGNGHSGRIRMFAPQRYLAPSGTYYNPESPDVQFPEGVGGNTRGKVNRCRTCHKLLSDHRQPQYNRGGFTCPDACALAAGCLSHPQHPNAVSISSPLRVMIQLTSPAMPPAVHED